MKLVDAVIMNLENPISGTCYFVIDGIKTPFQDGEIVIQTSEPNEPFAVTTMESFFEGDNNGVRVYEKNFLLCDEDEQLKYLS